MRTRLVVAGPVVVLVLALAATGSARMSGKGGRHVAPARALKITGGVRGLYPGARARLRLRVRNLRGKPVVRAHRTRRIVLRVTMLRSAPDACKGAVFRLRFRARGRRA
jgi:hypothetical protein